MIGFCQWSLVIHLLTALFGWDGVLNLAVFFAFPVLWPDGFDGPFDRIAAALGALAFSALFRCKWGVVPVIVLSAVAGMLGIALSN